MNLRHAAATYMLTQGVPLRVAMEVLGHSQIHVTANTYWHVIPELKKDAAERVGGLLFPVRDEMAVKMAVNGADPDGSE
ncbi:MAG: tyrosine-type recombinase/integrase [Dehalococcoidia bacterium]